MNSSEGNTNAYNALANPMTEWFISASNSIGCANTALKHTMVEELLSITKLAPKARCFTNKSFWVNNQTTMSASIAFADPSKVLTHLQESFDWLASQFRQGYERIA